MHAAIVQTSIIGYGSLILVYTPLGLNIKDIVGKTFVVEATWNQGFECNSEIHLVLNTFQNFAMNTLFPA